MTQVTVKLLNETSKMIEFYMPNAKKTAENLSGSYSPVCTFMTNLVGEDAAEEAFDLTNNPWRQTEREKIYGRGRSVSVGDKIQVDDQEYLCAPSGWVKL